MSSTIDNNSTISDNEFLILSEIEENSAVNQRALSKKLGISLGTVNMLINKMAREGKIKMEQVSGKQIAYMLTPKGFVGKAKKTVSYLKAHYHAIYETKENIKELIDRLASSFEIIYIYQEDNEVGEIVNVAISEYNEKPCGINFIHTTKLSDIINDQTTKKIAVINAKEEPLDENALDERFVVFELMKEI